MPRYVGGEAIKRLFEEHDAYRRLTADLHPEDIEWVDHHLDLVYDGRRDSRVPATLAESMVWRRA